MWILAALGGPGASPPTDSKGRAYMSRDTKAQKGLELHALTAHGA